MVQSHLKSTFLASVGFGRCSPGLCNSWECPDHRARAAWAPGSTVFAVLLEGRGTAPGSPSLSCLTRCWAPLRIVPNSHHCSGPGESFVNYRLSWDRGSAGCVCVYSVWSVSINDSCISGRRETPSRPLLGLERLWAVLLACTQVPGTYHHGLFERQMCRCALCLRFKV